MKPVYISIYVLCQFLGGVPYLALAVACLYLLGRIMPSNLSHGALVFVEVVVGFFVLLGIPGIANDKVHKYVREAKERGEEVPKYYWG